MNRHNHGAMAPCDPMACEMSASHCSLVTYIIAVWLSFFCCAQDLERLGHDVLKTLEACTDVKGLTTAAAQFKLTLTTPCSKHDMPSTCLPDMCVIWSHFQHVRATNQEHCFDYRKCVRALTTQVKTLLPIAVATQIAEGW